MNTHEQLAWLNKHGITRFMGETNDGPIHSGSWKSRGLAGTIIMAGNSKPEVVSRLFDNVKELLWLLITIKS